MIGGVTRERHILAIGVRHAEAVAQIPAHIAKLHAGHRR